ncbi:MAG: hypothetical protein ACYS19_16335, partial [Planctomycetota bacterium]
MDGSRTLLSYCISAGRKSATGGYRIASPLDRSGPIGIVSCISHMFRNARYIHRTTKLLLLLAVLSSGCTIYGVFGDSAPAADYYYLNPDKRLATIGRVAIVELNNDSSYTQISTDITESLFQALQKKQVFGLTVVGQQDASWRSLQLDFDSTYTLEQIIAIRETLKCDGILIGTITEFRPYPHMAVGLRLKLLDLRDGQLLWALEQVWDNADKTTESRIKSYFKAQKR